jgi:hypothetical protein
MGRTKKHKVNSTLYSFIFHTALLLTLSLVYGSSEISKDIVLDLAFAENANEQELVEVNFVEPEIPEEIFEQLEEPEIIEENIEPEPIDIVLDDLQNSNQNLEQQNNLSSIINVLDLTETDTGNVLNENVSTEHGTESFGDGDSEMLRRLSNAGAKTGDIQVSISWNNTNDIDLWVQCDINRAQERIGWSSKVGSHTYGYLDVDRNAERFLLTNEPVENIFWKKEHIKYGRYTVYLNYYQVWDKFVPTKVNIRIKINDKIINKQANIIYEGQWIEIYSFAVTKTTFK